MTPALHRTAPRCDRYVWCTRREPGHAEHQSAGVPVPASDAELALYAQTDPGSGDVTHRPVLGGDGVEWPVADVAVLSAQFRVAAARLDELAAWAQAS